MKLTKRKIYSQKILELHLIKSKIYKSVKTNINLNNIPNQRLPDIIINLKKSLNIIYKFHKNNKRILFIGGPKEIKNLINLKTIHKQLPSSCNINLQITNKFILNTKKINKQMLNTKKFSLSKISKKPELIVIFNHPQKTFIVNKSLKEKIPVIEFNYNLERNDLNYLYNIPTNYNLDKNKTLNNIFFIILNSLLNKSYN